MKSSLTKLSKEVKGIVQPKPLQEQKENHLELIKGHLKIPTIIPLFLITLPRDPGDLITAGIKRQVNFVYKKKKIKAYCILVNIIGITLFTDIVNGEFFF